MSMSSRPSLSSAVHYDKSSTTLEPNQSFSNYPITRAVAIIKPHALRHRFDIESRIQAANFEIIKERQMEFDTETDPDTLYELFGDDAASFSEGPVWVYVLERHRAVEVWNTLMGNRDPEVARKDTPNSLRALYGISLEKNGLMGSPDSQIAELQIASIFSSSPPFPVTDLPDERYGALDLSSSHALSSSQKPTSEEGYAPSNATNPSTVGGSGSSGNLNRGGKPTFRARPVPATTANPDIVPRTTRSAALRAGMEVGKTEYGPRAPPSKEQLTKTFANIPGHKRTEVIKVASTAAPIIAPRMTRAASLRIGVKPPEAIKRRALSTENAIKATFDGVPGHKRRESIAVASTKAPTVAPRLNKSAALRVQKERGPPTSFMFRASSVPKPPSLSKIDSIDSLTSLPSVAPDPTTYVRPASQVAQAPPSRYAIPRASSVVGHRPRSVSPLESQSKATKNGTAAGPPTATLRPRPSSVVFAPSILPRTNRSAALRAAKQEADSQAASVAGARKKIRPGVTPPSSFKAIVA